MGGESTSRRRFVAGLIGGGIATSLSPVLHEREADALGVSYSYQLIDIEALELGAGDAGRLLGEAQRMGFSGVNVTHPCKQVVIEHLDEVSPAALALGAVNTVVFEDGRSIGHNTDQPGFKGSFERGLPDAAIDSVVVLGAGGAGAAVAHGVLELGAARVTLVDVDGSRAEALALLLSRQFPRSEVEWLGIDRLQDALQAADGLIHATPTGMVGQPGMPFEPRLLDERLWVADIVYRPLNTELLTRARERGCRTLDGSGMVVIQAAASFALFTGLRPDRDRMFRELENVLRAEARSELEWPKRAGV